jgi:hypothetical protein
MQKPMKMKSRYGKYFSKNGFAAAVFFTVDSSLKCRKSHPATAKVSKAEGPRV